MIREPWKDFPLIWSSESKFIVWIRGGLRKLWSKHPIKLEYIKQFRKRIKNPNPKGKTDTVWGMTCEMCNTDTVQSQIEIDHRGEQGKFTTMSEIEGYARHLFMISFEDIRAVCKKCHKAISLGQRRGISFEDAQLAKAVIEKCKLPIKKQVDILTKALYNDVSNTAKRKKAWEDLLRKEMEDEAKLPD